MKAWIDMNTNTNNNQNTTIGSNNYQKIDAINNRVSFYFTILIKFTLCYPDSIV